MSQGQASFKRVPGESGEGKHKGYVEAENYSLLSVCTSWKRGHRTEICTTDLDYKVECHQIYLFYFISCPVNRANLQENQN